MPLKGILLNASVWTFWLAWVAVASVQAAPPKLTALFPAGGQRGSSFLLTTSGESDAVTRWWTDAPGVVFQPTAKPFEWQVMIPAETPAGLYQARLFNPEGATEARWFSVGKLSEATEVEPNNESGKGQSLTSLPVCINARLDKEGDLDCYQVPMKAGQTLVAMLEGYVLGSPVDIMAHVVNPQGERIYTSVDGRNLDPLVAFTAPEDGNYTLQIAGFSHPPGSDVGFAGGPAIIYRMHASLGPVVAALNPAIVSLTGSSEVLLEGYNLDPARRPLAVLPSMLRNNGKTVLVDIPDALVPLQALAGNSTVMLEREPNDLREKATPVTSGLISGAIGGREDADRFVVQMKKGEILQVRVWSKELGLPLDATLRVEGPDGTVLVATDDNGEAPDPVVNVTASQDGPHWVLVLDTLQRGGTDHRYVLQLKKPEPEVDVVLDSVKPINLAPGGMASIKGKISRRNQAKPLVARVANLPPGVHAPDVEIAEAEVEFEIKLKAAANAPRANQSFQVELWGKDDPPYILPTAGPMRGDALRGTSLKDSTGTMWLTVVAP